MYGEGAENVDKVQAMEDAIVAFSRLFSDAIMGKAKDLTVIEPLIARSNYSVLFVDFPAELQALRTATMFSDDYIQRMIMLALGPQGQLSAPFNSLESMVREYINMTRNPCRNAAGKVKNELTFTVEKCSNAMPGHISRYPVLMTVIVQRTMEFLAKRLEETQERLQTEIDMEWEYINVNHPDFDKVCDDPNLQTKTGASATSDAREEKAYETRRIKELLTADPKEFKVAMFAYIDIIYRNTLAMVPKVIFYYMINEVKEKLEGYLRTFFRTMAEDRLFDEPKDIIEKREGALDGIRECEEAKMVLGEMRQYCSRREG